MKRSAMVLGLSLWLVPGVAHAQLREMRQTIFGMDWAVCAHAVRVVVGKIEGVQSVKVSLKEGVATIRFAPSNRVTVARIREAIRSNGFTARDAEVQVAGSLAQRGDTVMLVIPGTDETFVLRDAPGAVGTVAELQRRVPSSRVVVSGRVPAPPERRGREQLFVRTFSPAG